MQTRLNRAIAATLAAGALVASGISGTADATPGNGNANGHGKGHCRALHAFGEGTDNGDGTTTATIYRARGKRELGTTDGTITPAGDPVEGVQSFTGTIVFTSAAGTLNAPVEGTFDTTTGDFAASSSEVTGTDGYADVTGKLRIWGTQDLTDGTFSEHLLAKLCVPKKKQH